MHFLIFFIESGKNTAISRFYMQKTKNKHIYLRKMWEKRL